MRNRFPLILAVALGASVLALGTPVLAASLLDGARAFQQKDYKAALADWRPLAIEGNPVAQNNLGVMYLDGKGVKQDYTEAVRWISLSAAAGSSLGQNNLGGLYRDGKGVPRDYNKAFRWFAAGAAQGNSGAQYNLGLMYELGQGIKAEPFHAFMWYSLAAEQDNMPNAAARRDALYSRMTDAAKKQAIQMTAACRANDYHGCG